MASVSTQLFATLYHTRSSGGTIHQARRAAPGRRSPGVLSVRKFRQFDVRPVVRHVLPNASLPEAASGWLNQKDRGSDRSFTHPHVETHRMRLAWLATGFDKAIQEDLGSHLASASASHCASACTSCCELSYDGSASATMPYRSTGARMGFRRM